MRAAASPRRATASASPTGRPLEVDTAINGRVIFFKSIARNEHAEHSNFVRVPNDLTVAQAVAIAEQ